MHEFVCWEEKKNCFKFSMVDNLNADEFVHVKILQISMEVHTNYPNVLQQNISRYKKIKQISFSPNLFYINPVN